MSGGFTQAYLEPDPMTIMPIYPPPPFTRVDPGMELVGIKDAQLIHKTLGCGNGSGVLTQTTAFYSADDWYQLSASACRVELVNNTGDSQVVTGCSIRAIPVYRLSGKQGYLHDKFSNYDDINRNGEREFKLENNMIMNLAQVNALADYWWKTFKTKKHTYKITLPGCRHWYKLGLWYTLQIGGAGEVEYIDSKVKLIGKTIQQSGTTIGQTVLTFVEVEENWKFDSSEVARFIASGIPLRGLTGGNVVTVASQYYLGTADYYCDGTADQVEIQAAIDYLVGSFGGGIVHLTRGQFNITAAIELDSNIVLEGEGAQSIIEKTCDDHAVECVGSDGSEKENAGIQCVSLCQSGGSGYLVRLSYSDNITISSCYFNSKPGGLYTVNCNNLQSVGNKITGSSVYSFYLIYSDGIISNNVFYDIATTDTCFCIFATGSSEFSIISNSFTNISADTGKLCAAAYFSSTKGGNFKNNKIYNLTGSQSKGIILQYSDNVEVCNNNIQEVTGYDSLYLTTAIDIDASSDNANILGNYCLNNGALINDGDCEDAVNPPQTDGNLATNTTAARSGVVEYEGDYSYKITKTNAAGTGASYWFVDNNTTTDMHGTVIKQGSYRLGLWGYVPTTGGCAAAEFRIVISQYYTGAWHDEVDTMTGLDAWEYLEKEITLNAAITGFKVGVEFLSTAAVNEFAYIDNVRLTPMGVGNEHNNNFYNDGTNTILG